MGSPSPPSQCQCGANSSEPSFGTGSGEAVLPAPGGRPEVGGGDEAGGTAGVGSGTGGGTGGGAGGFERLALGAFVPVRCVPRDMLPPRI
ncbi:MAG: hypothetical protein WBM00_01700 [Solirubrobacterales bacterium]